MKLYCRDGYVVAWHEDYQDVPAAAYGDGVYVVYHAGTLGDLERVGEAPERGPDVRPYVAPPIDLVAYAADARWRKETGGIVVNGIAVATDDRSKQMIIGARVAADADPDWTSQWVGANGVIYPINAAAIVAISNAIQEHVNACFATFVSVKSEIDAGTITTTAEIDAAFA